KINALYLRKRQNLRFFDTASNRATLSYTRDLIQLISFLFELMVVDPQHVRSVRRGHGPARGLPTEQEFLFGVVEIFPTGSKSPRHGWNAAVRNGHKVFGQVIEDTPELQKFALIDRLVPIVGLHDRAARDSSENELPVNVDLVPQYLDVENYIVPHVDRLSLVLIVDLLENG